MLWYQYRFANTTYIIQEVIISNESVLEYGNEELYTTLENSLIGKNKRRLRIGEWSEFQKNMKSLYPLIESIDISDTENIDTVYAQIKFYTPILSLSNQNNTWVIWDNQAYIVENIDAIQEWVTQLRLPDYTNEYTSLEWLFYVLHDTTLAQIVQNISDILDAANIVDIEYDPWGKKLHITYNNKLILFHLDKWLDEQLAKMLDISQYYTSYQNVSKIDLWSSDDIIVK